MWVFAVEVQRGCAVPRAVVPEVDAVGHRRVSTAAVPPVADANVVAQPCLYAVNADESSVHLGVTHCLTCKYSFTIKVCVSDISQLRQLGRGHNDVINRLAAWHPARVRVE